MRAKPTVICVTILGLRWPAASSWRRSLLFGWRNAAEIRREELGYCIGLGGKRYQFNRLTTTIEGDGVNRIIYIVGLVVIVIAILSFFGLR